MLRGWIPSACRCLNVRMFRVHLALAVLIDWMLSGLLLDGWLIWRGRGVDKTICWLIIFQFILWFIEIWSGTFFEIWSRAFQRISTYFFNIARFSIIPRFSFLHCLLFIKLLSKNTPLFLNICNIRNIGSEYIEWFSFGLFHMIFNMPNRLLNLFNIYNAWAIIALFECRSQFLYRFLISLCILICYY